MRTMFPVVMRSAMAGFESAGRRLSFGLLGMVLLVVTAGMAHAQQSSSIYVTGGGTLSYEIDTMFGVPCPTNPSVITNGWSFSQFIYTNNSGVSASLPGNALTFWSGSSYCSVPANPVVLTGSGYKITFTAQYADQDNSTAVYSVTPAHGALDLKYVVLGVTYAPPGAKSNVNYGGSTVFGTSSSLSKTFTNATSVSVSVGGGVKILGQGVTVTGTASTSFTQEADTSSSVAVSKTTTSSVTVPGPSSSALGVDHDYDIVWVWLNPQVNITVYSPTSLQWTGYTYDLRDPAAEMDIVPLYVLWLKNPALIPANVASVLAKTWDSTGQGGLTNTDYNTILQRDPFAIGASYNPNTDATHRFDLQYGETFTYQPPPAGGQPITQTYALNYQTTTTVGQGGQDTYQVGLTIDTSANFGAAAAEVKADLKVSNSTTWVNKWNAMTNNVSGQTASLSITGPATTDNYTGRTQIQVWKDNVYGTFMFYPVN